MGNILIISLSAMAAVSCLAYLIFDIVMDIYKRYKERYLEETELELGDIFLLLPSQKILDMNILFSVIGGGLLASLYAIRIKEVSILMVLFLGFVGFVVTFPIPKLIFRFLKKRRINKFNEQLEEALGNISGSLKAGFSINQAFDEIAEQHKSPISVEFRLLTQEIRLGVNMEEALANMQNRLQSSDFDLVVTAVITARQTGGELTSTLERLAGLIRERMRITRKLEAMTSMGRLQATLIGLMPFMLLWGMYYVSPHMVTAFFDTTFGFIALGVAIVLDIIGFLVIKKITTIDI
ncbi:MAG: type II secretion system F family protein [Lentisphaeria bacterium]|nr:type II secretion system F family protein [Lentisphaeria bacterium]MBR7127194.1 type II secretion system F family protein [Lentisphaeria bacterium]